MSMVITRGSLSPRLPNIRARWRHRCRAMISDLSPNISRLRPYSSYSCARAASKAATNAPAERNNQEAVFAHARQEKGGMHAKTVSRISNLILRRRLNLWPQRKYLSYSTYRGRGLPIRKDIEVCLFKDERPITGIFCVHKIF